MAGTIRAVGRQPATDLPDPLLTPRLCALKPRQQSAFLSLAAGATRLATAQRLGISESAVARWVARNPEAVAEAAGLVGRRLRNAGADDAVAFLLPDALNRLQQIIREGKEGPAVTACIEVLTRIFGRVPIISTESRDQTAAASTQRAVFVRIETLTSAPAGLLETGTGAPGTAAAVPPTSVRDPMLPTQPMAPMLPALVARGEGRAPRERRAYPSDRQVDGELVEP